MAQIHRLGEPKYGLCRLSYAFSAGEESWRPVEDGFFRGELRGTLHGGKGVLWRPDGEGRQLALPWDCAVPFLLMPLFCFVRLRTVRGRLMAVLAFDGEERPRMWEKF